MSRPVRILLVVGVLALALAVAACGGGKTNGVASLAGATQTTSGGNAGGSQDERQAALNWARCMRQHGINLPDPKFTASGIDQPLPARMRPDDARLRAAEQACHRYGGLGPAKPGGPKSGGGGR
jgi:hypothetical protein